MSHLRDFHQELRRRKVYRVAIAYAAVAFVVWQVADIAFPSLGLPDSAVTFVLALTVVAFPIALVLAWAYELTPEGAADGGTTPAGPETPGGPPATARTAGGEDEAESLRPGGSTGSDPEGPAPVSVAVLPFENMSTEAEGEYFADGIAEELTHALGRMPSLRVAARTSAFSFKGQRIDVREIGVRLGVGHVVEGSVRRSGERLRVTAQLIDARDGYHVWSDRFEREMDDVFAIQDEIVEAVVQSLRERLEIREPTRTVPQLARTEHLDAYDLYLRARHELRAFDGTSVQQSLELVDRSLELDPSFAPAHATRAEILTTQAMGFFQGRQGDLLARAQVSADRAIGMEPTLPEAHVAKALTLLYHDWAFAEARRELDRALELNPSYVDAHRWSEFYWTYVERDYDRAKQALADARALDPMDRRIDMREGTVEYLFGHYDVAESRLRKLLEETPDAAIARISLMDTLHRAGRWDEAARLALEMPATGDAPDYVLGVSGLVLATAGRTEAAAERLQELERRRRKAYALPFWSAVIHAGLGDLDAAFELLEEAVEERDGGLLFLAVTPRMPGFQEDPRFGRMLRRIGLGHLAPGIEGSGRSREGRSR